MCEKRKIKSFLQSTISMLLGCVILFNLFTYSYHETNEHQQHQEEVCSDEVEKDACHRFMVHHEESNACDKTHKHIEEKDEVCFVCHYYKDINQEATLAKLEQSEFYYSNNLSVNFSSFQIQKKFLSSSLLRGPPSNIA